MRFSKPKRPITLMEICGTHTMAIAKSGIKSLLPKEVKLISGPGCPVCVTPSSAIDMALELTKDPDLIVCSYGDLLRIPGSQHETLRNRPNVRLCLSPMDAIELAFKNPEKTILFMGVGFETTAPGSAILIQEARRNKLTNFYFYSLLKRTKPAICALLENEKTQIDGFLCPGHVAVILGEKGFEFLPEEYHRPGVISGFEPEDILISIEALIQMINQDQPQILNTYDRLVQKAGNPIAQAQIEDVFEVEDSLWRGLETLPDSGYRLKEKYQKFDAQLHFHLPPLENKEPQNCQCADILCGKKEPSQCPLFKTVCTPQDPVGPCMVSSEGACAAAYTFEDD